MFTKPCTLPTLAVMVASLTVTPVIAAPLPDDEIETTPAGFAAHVASTGRVLLSE